MNIEPEFGELIELYTNTAVIQAQRVPVHIKRHNRLWHLLNVTIAPVVTNGGARGPDFSNKLTMQLNESNMSLLAAGLMGLRRNVSIEGTRSPNSADAKVMYLNNNDDETTNIILSSTNGQYKSKQSITFQQQERYPLLRMTASQLTKNSQGFEQTVADTLNIIKASYRW